MTVITVFRKETADGPLGSLVLFTVASRTAGISYSTSVTLPDSPSAQALALLQRDFPAAVIAAKKLLKGATARLGRGHDDHDGSQRHPHDYR
jgi:hypothetical protein